jgi:hypothetical protein
MGRDPLPLGFDISSGLLSLIALNESLSAQTSPLGSCAGFQRFLLPLVSAFIVTSVKWGHVHVACVRRVFNLLSSKR